MISAWWLVLIVPVTYIGGFILGAMFRVKK